MSGTKPNRPRVVYLVSHPIQYQIPLFRILAQSRAIDFVAAFGCDFGLRPSFDPGFGRTVDFGLNLIDGYDSFFLPQARPIHDINRFWGLRLAATSTLWERLQPDLLILHGWRTAMMWQARLGCRARGTPFLIRAENPLFRGRSLPHALRARILQRMVRWFLGGAASVLSLGKANERYFLALGVSEKRFYRMPYFVDVSGVMAAASRGRAQSRELRASFGIPENAFVVVAVGKLTLRKRPFDLIDVLAKLPNRTHVLWIGTGEQEEACRRRIAHRGLEHRFHLAGFRPAAETWRLLGTADLFAMPSENEKWGLAINEAVAAGLPVIVSDECGAGEDLVRPGQTGEILSVGNISEWGRALLEWQNRLAAQADSWRRDVASELAAKHSTEAAAACFESAVMHAWNLKAQGWKVAP